MRMRWTDAEISSTLDLVLCGLEIEGPGCRDDWHIEEGGKRTQGRGELDVVSGEIILETEDMMECR